MMNLIFREKQAFEFVLLIMITLFSFLLFFLFEKRIMTSNFSFCFWSFCTIYWFCQSQLRQPVMLVSLLLIFLHCSKFVFILQTDCADLQPNARNVIHFLGMHHFWANYAHIIVWAISYVAVENTRCTRSVSLSLHRVVSCNLMKSLCNLIVCICLSIILSLFRAILRLTQLFPSIQNAFLFLSL